MEQREALIRSRNDLLNLINDIKKGELILDSDKATMIVSGLKEVSKRITDQDNKFLMILYTFINCYRFYEVCEMDTLYFAKAIDNCFSDIITEMNRRGEGK